MKKTLLWAVTSLLAVAGLFTACDDNKTDDTPAVPAVTLTAGEPTAETLTFNVALQDADNCSYLCTEQSSPAPDAAGILSAGKSVAASGSVTVKDLTPGTVYRISAVATRNKMTGEVKSIEMTTVAATPVVTLTEGTASHDGLAFTVALANAERAAYVCIEKTEDMTLPDAAQILETGTAIEAAGEIQVTGLKYGTVYVIAAAAVNQDVLSEVVSLEMTTATPATPIVSLTAGTASYNELTFTAALSDAERAAYVCIEKTEGMTLPDAAEILETGTAIEAAGEIQVTGLKYGTVYVIAAAAVNKDVFSEVGSLEMTTATPATPIVSLVAGTPAQNELPFYVATSDAEQTAYLCLEKSVTTVPPPADEILATGTAITDTKVTVSGLKAGTTYIIAVAASNKGVYSEVKTLEMTTEPEKAGPIVFTTQVAGGYYGDSHDSGYGEYHFVVADGAAAEKDGVYATVGAGRAMSFDLYQFKSYSAPIKIPARIYNYNTNYGLSTFAPEKTYCTVNDGNGNISKIEFTAGKVDIKLVGTTYTVTAELTTADGEAFSASYTGVLTIEDKQSQNKDLPALEKNVTGMTFIRALAKYYSYVDISDNCVVNLYDVEPTVNGSSDYLSLPGHMVTLNLATAVSQDMVLQEGTYTVSDTDAPGTFAAGYQTEFMDMVMAMGTYCEERNENRVSFYGLITGGTVVITKAGAGYRFELDFTTSKGYRIGGTYEGAVEMTDMRSKSASAAAQNARALKLRRQ